VTKRGEWSPICPAESFGIVAEPGDDVVERHDPPVAGEEFPFCCANFSLAMNKQY
jgi:hypothetical protein